MVVLSVGRSDPQHDCVAAALSYITDTTIPPNPTDNPCNVLFHVFFQIPAMALQFPPYFDTSLSHEINDHQWNADQ